MAYYYFSCDSLGTTLWNSNFFPGDRGPRGTNLVGNPTTDDVGWQATPGSLPYPAGTRVCCIDSTTKDIFWRSMPG